jgi:hypothetical protein
MVLFVEEAQSEFLDAIVKYQEARAAWDNDSRTTWTDASCGLKAILSYIGCGQADIVASISECSLTTFLMSSEQR